MKGGLLMRRTACFALLLGSLAATTTISAQESTPKSTSTAVQLPVKEYVDKMKEAQPA